MTSGVGPAAESAMDPGAEGPVSARWWRAYAVAVVDVEAAPEEDEEAPGGVVYLAPLPDGPVVVLEGVSAVLYRALTAASGDVVEEVARRLGVPPEDIDPETITEFAQELRDAGLVVRPTS